MKSRSPAIRTGLLLFAAIFLTPAVAQEAEDPAESTVEPPVTEEEQSTASESEEPRQSAADSLDTFVPSEEVSSDLSVSFPVDI